MSSLALIVVIGLLGGIAIGMQAPLASLIGQRLGALESIFIVHLGGLAAAGLGLLVAGGGKLGEWQSVPPVALLSGLLGVAVVGSTIYNVPRIGVAATIMLIITGQLCTGVVLDHVATLGAAPRPVSLERLAGLAVVLSGAWWTLRH
jgi:transporter family-2 protein